MKAATIYLIPVPIAEDSLSSLSGEVLHTLPRIRHFLVENARTARRHIRQILPEISIAELKIEEMHKHGEPDWDEFHRWIEEGRAIGIMSEAGCPGIADPGEKYIAKAQELGLRIHPLVGPNSLILALMASGLHGQQFAFHGYMPIKNPQRRRRIQSLEQRSRQENQTQIFIETPYRNQALFEELIQCLQPSTRLCMACDLTGKREWIRTRTIKAWKAQPPQFGKLPMVFLFLAGS